MAELAVQAGLGAADTPPLPCYLLLKNIYFCILRHSKIFSATFSAITPPFLLHYLPPCLICRPIIWYWAFSAATVSADLTSSSPNSLEKYHLCRCIIQRCTIFSLHCLRSTTKTCRGLQGYYHICAHPFEGPEVRAQSPNEKRIKPMPLSTNSQYQQSHPW